ncbi:ThuA domain-containing protein [Halieaceae bacterium]|nr:ThuA domain-containing protein [Halieaceae bacterium]
MKKLLSYLALIVIAVVIYFAVSTYFALDKAEVFKTPVYDTEPPSLPQDFSGPAVLVFSKTNSFRHVEAIDAANELFADFAKEKTWPIYFTENAAIHNAEQLKHFPVIIWNNNTGDLLTEDQQQALKDYINAGGNWLGIHGAAGTREFLWQWHPEQLLKARFIGHPMFPQFPEATIIVENQMHPTTKHLPKRWTRSDEWYSFAESPRARGVDVLASLDEQTYDPKLDLKMDGDHPLVWTHKIGDGTVFYSALGHKGSAYQEPEYRTMLENAIIWLMGVGAEDIPTE